MKKLIGSVICFIICCKGITSDRFWIGIIAFIASMALLVLAVFELWTGVGGFFQV